MLPIKYLVSIYLGVLLHRRGKWLQRKRTGKLIQTENKKLDNY